MSFHLGLFVLVALLNVKPLLATSGALQLIEFVDPISNATRYFVQSAGADGVSTVVQVSSEDFRTLLAHNRATNTGSFRMTTSNPTSSVRTYTPSQVPEALRARLVPSTALRTEAVPTRTAQIARTLGRFLPRIAGLLTFLSGPFGVAAQEIILNPTPAAGLDDGPSCKAAFDALESTIKNYLRARETAAAQRCVRRAVPYLEKVLLPGLFEARKKGIGTSPDRREHDRAMLKNIEETIQKALKATQNAEKQFNERAKHFAKNSSCDILGLRDQAHDLRSVLEFAKATNWDDSCDINTGRGVFLIGEWQSDSAVAEPHAKGNSKEDRQDPQSGARHNPDEKRTKILPDT